MLKEIDKRRLEKVKRILAQHELKFPVASVVEKTGENKGNVSNYLSGKKAMSDNFYTTFLKHFSDLLGNKNDKPKSSESKYTKSYEEEPSFFAELNEEIINAKILGRENNKLIAEIEKIKKEKDDLLIKIGGLENEIRNLKNDTDADTGSMIAK